MKTFEIYSKKSLCSQLEVKDLGDIVFVENGIRWLSFSPFLNCIFAFKRGFFAIGTFLFAMQFLFFVCNLLLPVFGIAMVFGLFENDLYGFWLKFRGYKIQKIVVGFSYDECRFLTFQDLYEKSE